MSESKDAAKTAKKAAKSQAKIEKKLGNLRTPTAEAPPTAGASSSWDSADSPPTPTPAERSAGAAERQVTLQRYRVLISLIAAAVALATFLITVKPWTFLRATESAPPAAPAGGDEPD
jgi:hypothetical protein